MAEQGGLRAWFELENKRRREKNSTVGNNGRVALHVASYFPTTIGMKCQVEVSGAASFVFFHASVLELQYMALHHLSLSGGLLNVYMFWSPSERTSGHETNAGRSSDAGGGKAVIDTVRKVVPSFDLDS